MVGGSKWSDVFSPKKVINLSWTIKKLHYKGEQYRSNGWIASSFT